MTFNQTTAALLADLMAINSVNPSFPGGVGEAEIAQWLAERCWKIGLEVTTQEVYPGRSNVLARLPADNSRGVLLFESHLDTVSYGTSEMEAPRFEGNFLYGRGACDTKGSLAAMLVALERLTNQTDRLAVDIILLGSVDEERAGGGAGHYVNSGGRADGAIVGEPTGLEVVVAHKGCIRFKITTRGRAAHSSKPGEGVNAIYKMAELIQHLRTNLFPSADSSRSHHLLGSPTFSVGVIHGGASVNIVPETCTIDIDYRSLPGEEAKQVLAEVDESIDRFKAEHDDVTIERGTPYLISWPLDTSESDPLVTSALKAKHQVTGSADVHGMPYGSDASLLAHFGGIPSIVLGPGDISVAHGPDESVDLREVDMAADIYQHLALGFEPGEMNKQAQPATEWKETE